MCIFTNVFGPVFWALVVGVIFGFAARHLDLGGNEGTQPLLCSHSWNRGRRFSILLTVRWRCQIGRSDYRVQFWVLHRANHPHWIFSSSRKTPQAVTQENSYTLYNFFLLSLCDTVIWYFGFRGRCCDAALPLSPIGALHCTRKREIERFIFIPVRVNLCPF